MISNTHTNATMIPVSEVLSSIKLVVAGAATTTKKKTKNSGQYLR